MIFRDATLADIESIATTHIASWQAGYRGLMPDDLLNNLSLEKRCAGWRRGMTENPDRPTLLCLIDSRVAGFLCYGPARDKDVDPKHTAEVIACYVHPDDWRQGIATKLWQIVHVRLRSSFDDVILWVLRDNDRARGFYACIGFTPDGTEKVDADFDSPLVEVRYRRVV
jgi:ribosomal protein S18 acetylase RimI-like enzyme